MGTIYIYKTRNNLFFGTFAVPWCERWADACWLPKAPSHQDHVRAVIFFSVFYEQNEYGLKSFIFKFEYHNFISLFFLNFGFKIRNFGSFAHRVLTFSGSDWQTHRHFEPEVCISGSGRFFAGERNSAKCEYGSAFVRQPDSAGTVSATNRQLQGTFGGVGECTVECFPSVWDDDVISLFTLD